MNQIVTVDLPQHLFETSTGPFNLKQYALRSSSAFAPSMPVVDGSFERLWTFTMEAAPMGREATIRMEAWFARLANKAWLFRAYDPLRQLPLGKGNGYSPANSEIKFEDDTSTLYSLCNDFRLLAGSTSALVKDMAYRGDDLIMIKGLDVALAGETILKTGDHFSIGLPGEMNLHMVISDVVCDANGEARLEFLAPLWRRVNPGDLVEFGRPTGRFQLFATDDNGSVELVRSSGPLSSGALTAIEYPWQEAAI